MKGKTGALVLQSLCMVLCFKDGAVSLVPLRHSFRNASQSIIFALLEIMTTLKFFSFLNDKWKFVTSDEEKNKQGYSYNFTSKKRLI